MHSESLFIISLQVLLHPEETCSQAFCRAMSSGLIHLGSSLVTPRKSWWRSRAPPCPLSEDRQDTSPHPAGQPASQETSTHCLVPGTHPSARDTKSGQAGPRQGEGLSPSPRLWQPDARGQPADNFNIPYGLSETNSKCIFMSANLYPI